MALSSQRAVVPQHRIRPFPLILPCRRQQECEGLLFYRSLQSLVLIPHPRPTQGSPLQWVKNTAKLEAGGLDGIPFRLGMSIIAAFSVRMCVFFTKTNEDN